MGKAKLITEERPREHDGSWREGKPVEDPDKTKRWGFVTAKPSEYLVHVRRGRVLERTSGQGASCFKWPSDAIAIVPTSLQRLSFIADQVTKEKVGVQVVGLAVYRIADPLIAYRVLNFSYPERAQEKLETTLAAMFVGATRRLIANLSVEDCLQKRKNALAEELLKEIAPIVGGEGRPSDRTDRGWGVVLDTVEIQEVRVMSERVFASMQAPYRAAVEQRAREARAEADKEIATREAALNRSVEEAKIAADMAVRERRAELDRVEAERQKERELRESAREREVEEARLLAEAAVRAKKAEIELEEAAAATRDAIERQRFLVEQAKAEIEAFAARVEAIEKHAALLRAERQAEVEQRRSEAELRVVEGHAEAAVMLERAQASQVSKEARARLAIAERLPDLAAAVGQRMGEVKITQIGGAADGGSPFGTVATAVASLVELARSA